MPGWLACQGWVPEVDWHSTWDDRVVVLGMMMRVGCSTCRTLRSSGSSGA